MVRNTEPQNKAPETKIQKMSIFFSELKFMVCFEFEILEMNFGRYFGHITKLIKINMLLGDRLFKIDTKSAD